jgi:hypothetical protein
VNTNQQDFRHSCQTRGGRSKCHVCEDIECSSDTGLCALQLQGVKLEDMSVNIPTVSDVAWPVNGSHRWDYGGRFVTHFCVFLSGGTCVLPSNTDFSNCSVRCFGYGFHRRAKEVPIPRYSVKDIYPIMQTQWQESYLVDGWRYPSNCETLSQFGENCTYSSSKSSIALNLIPSFNPQGFTFTVAGTGSGGFLDGPPETAQFNAPHGIAVDPDGIIYIADTFNHAIRMISLNGSVTTLAGQRPSQQGYQDGDCATARFSEPKGLDVRIDKSSGHHIVIVVVADTGNHRIRQLVINTTTSSCTVSCLSGLCGNNSLSATLYKSKASPNSGFADGSGLVARFSAPEGVAFFNDHSIVVADTGNFLIRYLQPDGNTSTLAGSIGHGPADADGNPLPGCPPPCLEGVPGYRDGNLSYAQFYNPIDVTVGPNNTIWVTDEHRIRLIELPIVSTHLYGIISSGRVSTIAGNSIQGGDDGLGLESSFFDPSGIFVTADNVVHVADSASCMIRRLTPMPSVAESITCATKAVQMVRPSGCTSFDQPYDKIGRKISRVEANLIYNYGDPYTNDVDRGKYIKNCVGTPPLDRLDKRFLNDTGDNLVIDDRYVSVDEDSEEGMAVIVHCPIDCQQSSSSYVDGVGSWYGEYSDICLAAVHQGLLNALDDGYIQLTFQRRESLNASYENVSTISTANNITRRSLSSATRRIFSLSKLHPFTTIVHSIAGAPRAPLESGCGYRDGQPATQARFNQPYGIAARYNSSLSDSSFLFVADTANHRIRAISAICTQICENRGRCIAHDKCLCADGWTGIDCTHPICNETCGANMLCVAPNTCACKPGYGGVNCDVPQCIQTCHNGGVCSAPDRCTCAAGWFDTNCTTPLCSSTCGNGGNCTAYNQCSCPREWTGDDCRIPVCRQRCLNRGVCVAPDTCACSPQYSGYDCSQPVCNQGYFEPSPSDSSQPMYWPTYKYCDLISWCNTTHEFECDQLLLTYRDIEVPSGPDYRYITGRKTPPLQCMNIELVSSYKLPFQLLKDDNSSTAYRRYSDVYPYPTNPLNPWRGYENPTAGHTGPWTYSTDRQVALVSWKNISQGVYVCANGGRCVAPDICECAAGWIGFDCRTPVCSAGYYRPEQTTYVSGQESSTELQIFSRYLGNNSYYLDWPYSNPNYTIELEFYEYDNASSIQREERLMQGSRYRYTSDSNITSYQGGYRCSIRAVTQWENLTYLFSHPNFYSRYMDRKVQADGRIYSYWQNLSWPPTHTKSRILDEVLWNVTYAFTNEGYRRFGIWNRTTNSWTYGLCLLEFYRNCSSSSKSYDLGSNRYEVPVQDTDLAYRPRIRYDDLRVYPLGRWKEVGGKCVDQVIRGCYNNGTCIAPNTCRCASGWTGSSCTIPVCRLPCLHNGNCTGPDQCTCERGWQGEDCSIPMCAQECQNGGYCIAPDTCKCRQWPNILTDGRSAGGRPLFQDSNGEALNTGWTGYDCSVPICVQAEKFLLSVASSISPGFVSLGGRGGDGLLNCLSSTTGLELPRCPAYDYRVTGNDGTDFQTGCGYDPYDTGCCILGTSNQVTCYRCPTANRRITNNTFACTREFTILNGFISERDKFTAFYDSNQNLRLCGKYHAPRYHDPNVYPQDYGVAKYYSDPNDPLFSSYNYLSNITSNRFLCNVRKWIQGDYINDAGLASAIGVGSIYGLEAGRHVRINYPNIIEEVSTSTFTRGEKIYGEGIYQCYNGGSCIGPDVCSCADGYSGYDCKTALCRHLQPTGKVTSCLNGGICISKDNCQCIQTQSVSWKVHTGAKHGITGWTGSDCSIPMCSQGHFDPFCTDLPQAPGGEGCYRCPNGGNCTAPDVCTCAEGWSGFDCTKPTCEVVADSLTRRQLGTVFEEKVIAFESDPCGVEAIYGRHGWHGNKYTRGNCTQPNVCTCLCKERYNRKACKRHGDQCNGPWQDPLSSLRNILSSRGPEYTFGSTDCAYGYEGNVNELDQFTTCHQTIYYPSQAERYALILIIVCSVVGFLLCIAYYKIRQRLRRRYLKMKIEKRKKALGVLNNPSVVSAASIEMSYGRLETNDPDDIIPSMSIEEMDNEQSKLLNPIK